MGTKKNIDNNDLFNPQKRTKQYTVKRINNLWENFVIDYEFLKVMERGGYYSYNRQQAMVADGTFSCMEQWLNNKQSLRNMIDSYRGYIYMWLGHYELGFGIMAMMLKIWREKFKRNKKKFKKFFDKYRTDVLELVKRYICGAKRLRDDVYEPVVFNLWRDL